MQGQYRAKFRNDKCVEIIKEIPKSYGYGNNMIQTTIIMYRLAIVI